MNRLSNIQEIKDYFKKQELKQARNTLVFVDEQLEIFLSYKDYSSQDLTFRKNSSYVYSILFHIRKELIKKYFTNEISKIPTRKKYLISKEYEKSNDLQRYRDMKEYPDFLNVLSIHKKICNACETFSKIIKKNKKVTNKEQILSVKENTFYLYGKPLHLAKTNKYYIALMNLYLLAPYGERVFLKDYQKKFKDRKIKNLKTDDFIKYLRNTLLGKYSALQKGLSMDTNSLFKISAKEGGYIEFYNSQKKSKK